MMIEEVKMKEEKRYLEVNLLNEDSEILESWNIDQSDIDKVLSFIKTLKISRDPSDPLYEGD